MPLPKDKPLLEVPVAHKLPERYILAPCLNATLFNLDILIEIVIKHFRWKSSKNAPCQNQEEAHMLLRNTTSVLSPILAELTMAPRRLPATVIHWCRVQVGAQDQGLAIMETLANIV